MKITLDYKTIDLKNTDFNKWINQVNGISWKLAIIDFLQRFSDESNIINLRTSGSTGKPKVIKAQKKHLINSAKATCKFFNLTKNSTGLLCMNAQYIGAQMMLIRAIVSGMNLITMEPKANPIKELKENIDFIAMVPYQVENSLNTIHNFNRIKNPIIGGGQTNSKLVSRLNETIVNCYETFGMTETYSHIALKQIAPASDEYFNCIDQVSVNKNENDQLIVNAPNLGIKELITNDLIEFKTNTSFRWLGRIDNIINSGGIKLSPEEIEKNIQLFVERKFCILGFPHQELGEQVILVIEGNEFETSELKKLLTDHLSKYHIPKQIIFYKEFPLTQTGKIKRQELKKLI